MTKYHLEEEVGFNCTTWPAKNVPDVRPFPEECWEILRTLDLKPLTGEYQGFNMDPLLENVESPMAKGAVRELRGQGVKAGLFRPITVWPFPIDLLKPALDTVKRIVVVEASPGQLEDELRLAMSKADIHPPPIDHVRHYGGILPQQSEIVVKVLEGDEVAP